MGKYLFLATKTNALSSRNRLVGLSFSVYNENREKEKENSFLINPKNYCIDDQMLEINNLSMEQLETEGVDPMLPLLALEGVLKDVDLVVCHNISFHIRSVGEEYLRVLGRNPLLLKDVFCTMSNKAVVEHCALGWNEGRSLKYPSLVELYKICHGHTCAGMNIINVIADNFFKLKDLKVICL